MFWRGISIAVALPLGVSFLLAQEPSPSRPNRLTTGKLVYVERMPEALDRWIIDDMRVWGKFKTTSNPEGVDLVIRAEVPERTTEIDVRGRTPRPVPGRAGIPLPKR